jgi:integrase
VLAGLWLVSETEMGTSYVGRWEGGEVQELEDGSRSYVVSRRIRGRRFRFSTRAATLKEARAIYRRFITDPDNFQLVAPPPDPNKGPIPLNDKLVESFLAYSDAKGNTGAWRTRQRAHLRVLQRELAGQDLRGLNLSRLLPIVSGDAHRTAIVKTLYSWLRKVEHRLSVAEDPTFGALSVPQRKPGARRIADKAVPRAAIDGALAHLPDRWRALLALQSGTGIHTTELQRFARSGRLLPYVGPQRASAVMVIPLHKNGDEHRVALDQELASSAQKVLDGGRFGTKAYHFRVRRACFRAQVPVFTPGRMRHTVATELVNAGTDMAAVSTFLGHRTLQTTRAWYARFATPRNPVLDFNSSASRGLGQ